MTALDRVVITTPTFGAHSNRPWEALDEHGLAYDNHAAARPLGAPAMRDLARDATALIVGLDTVDDSVLAAGTRLRVVAKHGVGVDNIDIDAATARGIMVVNAPGSNTDAVADLTVGLILDLTRQVLDGDRDVRNGGWSPRFGPQLSDMVVGLVGFGRIGRAVAHRVHAFGTPTLAHDPFVPDDVVAQHHTEAADIETVFRSADIISLHLPNTDDGVPLVDAQRLRAIKRGAYLINAARGTLVDETAVATALVDGHLAGYAADAFEQEPPTDSPLLRAPRTILTPHIGACTAAANAAMGVMVVDDIVRVLRGERPRHPVTGPAA